jgi:hypothetical protein
MPDKPSLPQQAFAAPALARRAGRGDGQFADTDFPGEPAMDVPLRPKAGAWPLGLSRWQAADLFDLRLPLTRAQFWIICASACAIALLFRLPTLAGRSLWLDEAYSAWFSAVPLHELWTQVPLYETHPPFYYTLLKGWRLLAGSSEAGLRSLSVLASVCTVFMLAVAGRAARLGPLAERVGLLSALFLALNAGNVQFAQDARPYALQTLAASGAIFCSFMLIVDSRSGRSRRACVWAAGVAIAGGLTLWLHDTGVFIALGIWTGLGCAALARPPGSRRELLLLAGAAGLGALLVWLPFVPMFLKQGAGISKLAYWIEFVPSGTPSAWVLPAGGKPLKGPAAVLGLAGIIYLWRRRRDVAWHLLMVLALAPLAMAAYSFFIKPIFLPRLFEWLAPLMMALMALGAFALPSALRKPAVAIVLAASAWSLYRYYDKPTENWREMVAMLSSRTQPGDLVLAFPNEVQPSIDYYLDRWPIAADIVYLPRPFPAPGMARRYVGNLGAPAVNAADAARVRALLPHYRRAWLLERRADLYDPGESVAAAVKGRFVPVEIYEGIGARITLFEPKTAVLPGTVPRRTGPGAGREAERARRRAAAPVPP